VPFPWGGRWQTVRTRAPTPDSCRLRIRQPDDDALRNWQHVRNTVIPTHLLSLDEIRERARRHHPEAAYLGDEPVGCSTVRPPEGDTIPWIDLRLV
jgi:hypothetical protein